MSIIQDVLTKLCPVFEAAENSLNEWVNEKHDGNLQFPVLLGRIAVKLNWDEKQVRENDPLVRYYIRNNPEWHVTRGAHGGIMPASFKNKKEQLKAAKKAAKEQIKSEIELNNNIKPENCTDIEDQEIS
jgi:hypothetical protein